MAENKPFNILLVDDEDIVHKTLAPYLTRLGHRVESTYNGNEGLSSVKSKDYELAIVDMRMPGLDGLKLLAAIQEVKPETAVVILTGHGSMELAIEALRLGAADFLTKPVKLVELDALLERVFRFRQMQATQRRLTQAIEEIQTSDDSRLRGKSMVAESSAMKDVREQIKIAVEANLDTILITGETGTGKEVVAREVHFSTATGGLSPFIAISCPAIPETLIESELFGHVKGSFTGATVDKAGCFEIADGGTLFLDEVADLSEGAQAKLLRVLETRAFRRVGGSKEKSVNVRVVAATNTLLEDLVKQRKFRQDLYYRLNVFSIHLKPIRERVEDIMPLAGIFLESFVKRSGLKINGFSDDAKESLMAYSYPGNARELRNIVERSAVLCRSGFIGTEHLNLPVHPGSPEKPLPPMTRQNERDVILEVLERTKWNRLEAAKELDIPYSSLRYKIKKYGIK